MWVSSHFHRPASNDGGNCFRRDSVVSQGEGVSCMDSMLLGAAQVGYQGQTLLFQVSYLSVQCGNGVQF